MEVFTVSPRGFCAGVRRALEIVDRTLQQYGAPVYVRHEIVHNRHIIEDLKRRGVIFIDKLEEVSDVQRPVIFSAHGVAEAVKEQARQMNLITIDATCPLVMAVHEQIRKLAATGADIIVIGKASHPEILGTVGQLDDQSRVHIVTSLHDARALSLPEDTLIGIVTQTTLAFDDTKEIMDCLHAKFSNIINASRINICFATTNRQKAVQKLAQITPNIIIIGSQNSSNSAHIKEAALHFGARQAWLIDDVSEFPAAELDNCDSFGISAGASAPEYLVEELLAFLQKRYDNINIHDVIVAEENISFKQGYDYVPGRRHFSETGLLRRRCD